MRSKFNVNAKNYLLSKETSRLDHFLSHDWGSSRWLKLVALLVIHNSGPAFCASLATSLLVGVLVSCKLLPYSLWTVLIGHFSFFFVFCFWQRIRGLFFRPLMVFLDTLCIAQHDEKLKQKGILGLGAFLVNSKKLVVLWTPRYFERLWCTFEIATFMKDPDKRGQIHIMPLKMGALVVMYAAFWHVLGLSYAIFYMTRQAQTGAGITTTMYTSGLMLAFAGLVVPVVFYFGVGFLQDLADLPQRFEEFRVQDAKCYCCSNGHKHPKTGASLPCDRRLVFKTLRKFYHARDGEPGGEVGEDYMDRFNTVVREELAPELLSTLQRTGLPLRYLVCVLTSATHPSLCFFIPRWWSQLPELENGAVLTVTLRFFVNWACFGTACLFSAGLMNKMGKVALRLRRHGVFRSHWCMQAMLLPPLVLVTGLLWFSVVLSVVATDHSSLLCLAPFSIQVVATAVLLGVAPSPHRRLPSEGGESPKVQQPAEERCEVDIFEV
ncbi:unnamed protein product [Symbiodinium natans]|uniref:Uncharacterized protein n=1 Tax=Symbiodinium natans TaxID=878477 RepID=A0A812SK35_9DINO|nr:unnamed protein product [Symbiodinium natans]